MAKKQSNRSQRTPPEAAVAAEGGPSSASSRATAALEKSLVQALQQYSSHLCDLMNSEGPGSGDSLLDSLTAPPRIARLVGRHAGPLDATCVEAVFREVSAGVRGSIRTLRVAFLGPDHSYSHLAALRRFGHSAELVALRTISAVFEEVSAQQVDAGVVPIENSTDGRIVDTLEMFLKTPVKICGELPLRIHHQLLGKGPRQHVHEVCSKPQALSQCREWLANHLPDAKLTPTTSTTVAAERARSEPNVGAIASRQAGKEYGLRVLAENIEDNRDNVTRFAVIGREPAARTGEDKTSLMFEVSHQPGALADAMVIFKKNRLNLTWIESFPKPGSPNEYLFFVELVGHQRDLRVRRALQALAKKTVRFEILGSYPKVEPVE
jgi:chorismate mutase/prephenate dehydratase